MGRRTGGQPLFRIAAIFFFVTTCFASRAAPPALLHSPDHLPEIDRISDGVATIPNQVFSKYDDESIGRAIARLVQRRNHGRSAPATFYVPKKYADRYFEYQIRVPEDALGSILKNGLGNLPQTGTSGGWPEIETRLAAEAPHWQLPFKPGSQHFFGTRTIEEQIAHLGPVGQANLLDVLPKYGYITSPNAPSLIPRIPGAPAHYVHDVKRYGDVILVLKPETKSRMTHYPGDSLAAFNNDLFRAMDEDPVSTVHLEMRRRAPQAAPYLEFQIFGKVRPDDIAEIRVLPGFRRENPALFKRLEKSGIPVTEYAADDSQRGYRRGKTLLPGSRPLLPEPPEETEKFRSEMGRLWTRFQSQYQKGARYLLEPITTDTRRTWIEFALDDNASPPEAKRKLMKAALAPDQLGDTLKDLQSLSPEDRKVLVGPVADIAPQLAMTDAQQKKLFQWIHDSLPPKPSRERNYRKFLNAYSENGGGPVGKLVPTGETAPGSTKPVWVKDELGVKWLIKRDTLHPELQTAAEVISSDLYRHFGYNVPTAAIVSYKGKRAVAIRSLGDGLRLSNDLSHHDTPKFRQLRVVAAYLKDWDRTHAGPNNASLESGDFALFDFGGTLGSRARGEFKPGPVVSEAIGSFGRDETTVEEIVGGYRIDHLPPDHPWRHLDAKDIQTIANEFRELPDEVIEDAVAKAHFKDASDAEYMIDALKSRRDVLGYSDDLLDYFKNFENLKSRCSEKFSKIR